MPSFVVIVEEVDEGHLGLSYLTEDLGEVLDPLPEHIALLGRDLSEKLRKRGYILTNRSSAFGLVKEGSRLRLVFHDLDETGMFNSAEIRTGANEGKGRFARLAEIYDRLRSPEYRLSLEKN